VHKLKKPACQRRYIKAKYRQLAGIAVKLP